MSYFRRFVRISYFMGESLFVFAAGIASEELHVYAIARTCFVCLMFIYNVISSVNGTGHTLVFVKLFRLCAAGSFKGELIVQELCESRGGRPGLSVLTSLLVSVDVKNY